MGYGRFYNELYGKKSILNPVNINLALLKELWNGIVICDEVHNVYNSLDVNNWGEALLLVSVLLQKNVKMLYMSGTPINNPQEIYDLCNLVHDDNMTTYPNQEAMLDSVIKRINDSGVSQEEWLV
jgi:hypothetical protein